MQASCLPYAPYVYMELQNLPCVLPNGCLMSEGSPDKEEMDRGNLITFRGCWGDSDCTLCIVYAYNYTIMIQNGKANSFEDYLDSIL